MNKNLEMDRCTDVDRGTDVRKYLAEVEDLLLDVKQGISLVEDGDSKSLATLASVALKILQEKGKVIGVYQDTTPSKTEKLMEVDLTSMSLEQLQNYFADLAVR